MNFHFVSFEFNPYTLESSKRTYNHAKIWSQLLGQNVEFGFLHVGQLLVGILGINWRTRLCRAWILDVDLDMFRVQSFHSNA